MIGVPTRGVRGDGNDSEDSIGGGCGVQTYHACVCINGRKNQHTKIKKSKKKRK